MIVKLLTEYYLEFLSLRGGYTGLSEYTIVKMVTCHVSYIFHYRDGKVALQILVWAFHNPEELLSSNFTSNYTHMECITLVSSEYRGVMGMYYKNPS